MDRQEAMTRFLNREAKEAIDNSLLKMDLNFFLEKEELAISFQNSFIKACEEIKKMQESQHLGLVSNLFVVMKRSRLMESNGTMDMIAANNEGWFDEERKVVGSYDCNFILRHWNELKDTLELKRKQYVGKTMKQDTNIILQSQADKMIQYAARIARYHIHRISETEEFCSIKTDSQIDILVGEYMDYAELVYRKWTRKRTNIEYMFQIEQIRNKKQEELCIEDLRGLELSDIDLSGGDYRFADFRNNFMKAINLQNSLLIGTIFCNNILSGSSFRSSLIYEANFEGCELQACDFSNTLGNYGQEVEGQWENAGYFNINFKNANLTNANFSNSKLKGADFTGCRLWGADFTGAVLKGAIFETEHLKQTELTNDQRMEIRMEQRRD